MRVVTSKLQISVRILVSILLPIQPFCSCTTIPLCSNKPFLRSTSPLNFLHFYSCFSRLSFLHIDQGHNQYTHGQNKTIADGKPLLPFPPLERIPSVPQFEFSFHLFNLYITLSRLNFFCNADTVLLKSVVKNL